ncbi:MAG: ABC transporter ATP-binding protein, partial [Ruminococcus sp.]
MSYDEQEYTKSFDIKIWKKVLPFLKPFRKVVLMVILLNLFCSAVDIALPLFQRYSIDNFIETGITKG